MSRAVRGGLRRALRWFTLGSGPLKRRSDRVQALGRVVVALSLLAAAPLGVVGAAVTRGQMETAAAAQALQRHAARAVVLEDTRAVPDSGETTNSGGAGVSIVRVEVAWPDARGAIRHGALLVPAGTVAGTTVPVWVDRSGDLPTAPMDQEIIGATSLGVGLLATTGVPLVTWVSYCLLCAALDAHRRRGWARDWDRVEREWRTRLR